MGRKVSFITPPKGRLAVEKGYTVANGEITRITQHTFTLSKKMNGFIKSNTERFIPRKKRPIVTKKRY